MAVLAMIAGSIKAIQENHIKRMIAFSSVAQMGYIYLGIGLGNMAGLIAACFHIIVHAITKPMLFSSAGGLASASHHKKDWEHLKGAAYRNPIAAVAFLIAYILYAEVLRENTYLSRTIEVQDGQTVVDTGLYGIVRHPMYSVTLLLFISMPLVLGSLIALPIFLLYPFIIAKRIKHEEEFLERELAGYTEYKSKVKYRLIPFIW